MNLLNNKEIEISIIIPCLNEEAAISSCLSEVKKAIKAYSLAAEIIVVDNNSDDKSAAIVLERQKDIPELILKQEEKRGYGFAYLCGLESARGKYIFMADADSSYDFLEINKFLTELKKDSDLVIGNRFSGAMEKKAMSSLHRYLGNPFLSFLVRALFKVKIKDIHCGARAMRQEAYKKIGLQTGGMEFASEMIIKASKHGLKISEVPIKYRPRLGNSKLRSLADGWRHLRFILLYSPLFVFLSPGLILFFSGFLLFVFFYFFNPEIFGIQFYFHPLFLFSFMMILGYQLIFFAAFSKIYASNRLGDKDKRLEKLYKYLSIEKAGFLGLLIFVIGAALYLSIFFNWLGSGLASLDENKSSIAALTFSVLGAQTFFSAFMLSILGIQEK